MGIAAVGYIETSKREYELKEETQKTAVQISKEIASAQELLSFKAKSITDNSALVDTVANRDKQALLRILLPLKLSLKLDLVKIIDQQGDILADLRSSVANSANLQDSSVMELAQRGLLVDGLVVTEKPKLPLLIKTLSVTSQRDDVGSILVGYALTPEVLTAMLGAERQQIVLLQNSRPAAATLPIDNFEGLTAPRQVQQIQLDNVAYLGQTVVLPQIASDDFQLVVLTPLAKFHASQRQMWFVVYGIGLLGGLLISIAGIWTTRLITRRITRLTEATKKLAADDLSVSLPVEGSDEVAILAEGFNNMTEQLKLRDSKIKAQVEELEWLVQQLQQMPEQVHIEKMAGLGQMVAGVAHEINNPVSFIYGNVPPAKEYVRDLVNLVRLYQKHLSEPPQEIQTLEEIIDVDFVIADLSKLLDSVETGAERIREIVLSLRTFSRKDEALMKAVNIHDGLDSTLVILEHRFKARTERPAIAVVKEYDVLPPVQCFAGEINQVFMNLLSNAIDALEEQSQLSPEKSVDGVTAHQPQICLNTRVLADSWIAISIADNGPGIPEEIRSKLFEPFFTTKAVGKGTGLGLSISYQIIVEKHGGKIWCNSKPGQGTEFIIQLPLVQPSAIA